MRVLAMIALAMLSTSDLARVDRLVGSIRDEIEVAKATSGDPKVEVFRAEYVNALERVLDEQAAKLDARTVDRALDDLMAWANETFGPEIAEKLAPEAQRYLESAFRAGQQMRSVPDDVQVLWDAPRQEARDWLVAHDRFWVGKVFPDHLAPRFRSAVVEGLEAGLGRDDIARRLRALVSGDATSPAGLEAYRRIASASVTRARNWGSMHALEAAEIERYVWRAVGDERMCARCSHFDGQAFGVPPAMDLVRQALAGEPAAIESLAPWPSEDAGRDDFYIATADGREYIRDKAPDWLQAHGMGTPPLHANCRCVVIAEV